jgi:hypothetical protein
MPADRLTHPRIGRSQKVTSLSDFEFRVWDTYRWAADDYGVMPKSAAKLRGENDALRNQHTDEEVSQALQRLVEIDLITEFDHQGASYVCSITWQEHQKIEHPRQTHLPAPPPQVLASMDSGTRKLFRNSHGDFQKSAASRARVTRETANGKRLTANGSGDLLARFEMFWGEYPRKVGKDAARKEWLQRSPDVALTNLMITKVREQRASAQWLKNGGEYIPHPRTWLHQGRWQDEPDLLRAKPAQKPDWYGHFPHCRNETVCAARYLEEQRTKAAS